MIEFVFGIALGAAFSPFWMKVWNSYISPAIKRVTGSKTEDKQ